MNQRLIIGTRASKLAMRQTRWVITQLQRRWPSLEIVVEQIRTTGDAVTHVPLTKIGGDGVFVMEIERALAEKRIDVAVHSLKDLPTIQPPGLCLLVPGPREDARDVLISRHPCSLDATPPERIGTCSLRRTAQIRALFPQAEILPLRGNVDTRLRKLEAGEYDAIILAVAGLLRLGISADLAARMTYLSFEQVLPAPGQGALGLEVRNEPELLELLSPLNDHATQATTSAERVFMRRLGAGCYLPVAAYATIANDELTLTGLVASLDGCERVHVSRSIPWMPGSRFEHAEQLGIELAEEALERGAEAIIATLDSIVREQQHV
ncbi:MAG TPA: hydroxymethylbilane synthase [Ktedonobacteraceae bacterium]|nr:hydroxymethylbilane synthase [Ktedonobacteraceae bacterium]